MIDYTKLSLKKKKAFWKENPIVGEIDIKIPGINSFKMFSDNDDTVVKELYWTDFKGWELTSLVLWNDLIKSINTEDVVYDIGAYSGIYSLIGVTAAKVKKIIAFDIQKITLERLAKNCSINNIGNIQLVRAACTSFNGEATFYFYKEDGIISSVAGLVKKEMNNLEESVKAIRLDDFNSENNNNAVVSLMKIDVEDAEIETLKGMQDLLKNNKPDVLLEVNDNKKLKKVKKLFPNDYVVYDIDEEKLLIKKLKWYSKPSKFRNYLFTTKNHKILKEVFTGNII